MKKKNWRKKIQKIICAAGLLFLVVHGIGQIRQYEVQQSIASKIIRFHIIANSDTAEDQALKLKVRDGIGAMMEPLLEDADDISVSRDILKDHLAEIQQRATQIIGEEGYSYEVEAELKRTKFPEKEYGSYTFAAGDYEALEVTIGDGEGHNWWCVMYPNMCFAGSMYEEPDESRGRALRKVLTEEEYASIIEKGNYSLKCRYFTVFNKWL